MVSLRSHIRFLSFLFCFRRSALHFLASPFALGLTIELVASFHIPDDCATAAALEDRHSVKLLGFGLHI